MKLYVENADQIKGCTADDRGRITLESEYAGETVQIAVLEREHDDDENESN